MKAIVKIMLKTPRLEALDLNHCRDVSDRGIRILAGRINRGFRIGFESSYEV